MKYIRVLKGKLKVTTGYINWKDIGRVTDCEGDEYTLTPVGNDEVRMVGDGEDHTVPTYLTLSVLNIYDKQGNLVNDLRKYM